MNGSAGMLKYMMVKVYNLKEHLHLVTCINIFGRRGRRAKWGEGGGEEEETMLATTEQKNTASVLWKDRMEEKKTKCCQYLKRKPI